MSIIRLVAENIGPFDRLDLDLSDGNGRPHLGPHVIAGVNGSGKSTVLRTLAWLLDFEISGFDALEFGQLQRAPSRAAIAVRHPLLDSDENAVPVLIRSTEVNPGEIREVTIDLAEVASMDLGTLPYRTWPSSSGRLEFFRSGLLACGYAPTRVLRRLLAVDLSVREEADVDSLSFDSTVKNEVLQSWLTGLIAREALAEKKGRNSSGVRRILQGLEKALAEIYGEVVKLEVNEDQDLEPYLSMFSQRLNFSQLPDGVRTTLGWIGDYLRRQDRKPWNPHLNGKRPGVLLLDEIESHLHPLWQRRVLPAMREALPDVQIIAASHSPFLISSGARVHVMEISKQGRAFVRESIDAPVGQRISTVLKDIFNVPSPFDSESERMLQEWNDLAKLEAVSRISAKESRRLDQLTDELSKRSDDLRSIVAGVDHGRRGRKAS